MSSAVDLKHGESDSRHDTSFVQKRKPEWILMNVLLPLNKNIDKAEQENVTGT